MAQQRTDALQKPGCCETKFQHTNYSMLACSWIAATQISNQLIVNHSKPPTENFIELERKQPRILQNKQRY